MRTCARVGRWSVVLVAALAACLPSCAGTSIVEGLPPIVLGPDESRPDWYWAGRIVDAIDGRPIAGASLHWVQERSQPEGGRFWSDGCWQSDADGFVRVPVGGHRRGWWIFDAPGYGPIASMSYPEVDPIVRLAPGVDLPVVVTDFLERPVAGAELGWCIGCGHTPDLRVATTDARGHAWLRGVDPDSRIRDIYVRHPGLSGVSNAVHWRPGDAPMRLRPAPVPVVRGRVTSVDGSPLARVAVGGSLHRGPWTWTDAEGRFSLVGREDRWDFLNVVTDEGRWRVRASADSLAIALPPPAAAPPQPTARLRVHVRDARTREPIQDALVFAVVRGVWPAQPDESDDGTTRFDAMARLDLVPGDYDLRVEDPVAYATHERSVHMTEADQDVTVDLMLRPVLAVRLEGWEWSGSGPEVHVVTESSMWKVPLPDGVGGVPVPDSEPFVLRVTTDCDERAFPFAAMPRGPLVLRPHAATRVLARLVDAGGTAVAGRAALLAKFEVADMVKLWAVGDGDIELSTRLTGAAFLYVEPQDAAHRPTLVPISLPARGDDSVCDVGHVALDAEARPALRCVAADGTQIRGSLRLLRIGCVATGDLEADGGWNALAPRPGDRVVVCAKGDDVASPGAIAVAWSEVLVGTGPWTLVKPEGCLRLDIRDEDGRPVELFDLVVGDQYEQGRDGSAVLTGLKQGPVEVFVGAERLASARVRATIGAGPSEPILVRLLRR